MLWSVLTIALVRVVLAQSTCSSLSASYPAPSVAAGYTARLVANDLQSPRSIQFDTEGRLLVVEQGLGVQALSFNDGADDCVSLRAKDDVVRDDELNHGLALSADGKTLYASSEGNVYSYDYDPSGHSTSSRRTLVTGMSSSGHETRTLFLSRLVPSMLLVSRGSQGNNDIGAADISTGRSQIKAFNLSTLPDSSPYDYASDGMRMGWGLRNSVGIGEHPITGGIYSVENSVDQMERDGVDIHETNPGEEMNFHGYLNGTQYSSQGQNYGYPTCFSAWNTDIIPNNSGIQTGTQFAIGSPNSTVNDDICKNQRVAPRLTFPAHWAPLDIVFNNNGTMAYLTSHGSWNSPQPVGYLLGAIAFDPATGELTEPATSKTAVTPIMSNVNDSACPEGCFRPVGLAWDQKGRLFMSSDSTGEIYMITRAQGNSSINQGPAPSSTRTGSAPVSTSSQAAAEGLQAQLSWLFIGATLSVLAYLR